MYIKKNEVYFLNEWPQFYYVYNTNLSVNILRPGQNGQYFADDSFKYILSQTKFRILIKHSLKFFRDGPFADN